MQTASGRLDESPLVVTRYRVPSALANRWINYGVREDLLDRIAELRLETNEDRVHRLTLEMSSPAGTRVAVFLNNHPLGEFPAEGQISCPVPAEWLRPDSFAFVRLEPPSASLVRLHSISLEPAS